jgi:hypothetical protein
MNELVQRHDDARCGDESQMIPRAGGTRREAIETIGPSLIDRTRAVLTGAIDLYRGTQHHARLVTMLERLDGPLLVSIAGRAKSGQSSLLYSLMGESLAPKDADERMHIIARRPDDIACQVMIRPRMGEPHQAKPTGAKETTEVNLGLTKEGGLDDLTDMLGPLFFERRDDLKSGPILLALDALLRTDPRPGCELLAAHVEEIIASAHSLRELRMLSCVRSGSVCGKPEVMAELEQLMGGSGVAAHHRLQLPADAGPSEIAAAASEALARWQRRAENPLTHHELAVAARVVVQSCERILVECSRLVSADYPLPQTC